MGEPHRNNDAPNEANEPWSKRLRQEPGRPRLFRPLPTSPPRAQRHPRREHRQPGIRDTADGEPQACQQPSRIRAFALGIKPGLYQPPQDVATEPERGRAQEETSERLPRDGEEDAPRIFDRAPRPERRLRGQRANHDIHDTNRGIAQPCQRGHPGLAAAAVRKPTVA
jgi:hypothetical protein